MRIAELVPGEHYAARLRGMSRTSRPVEVTMVDRHAGGRVRVRLQDGDEQVARSGELLCPWAECTGLLRDEDSAARMAEADREVWDQVQADAIDLVLHACDDGFGFRSSWGIEPPIARRVWERAGQDDSPLGHHPANYTDRNGRWHLSIATALAGAHELAVREPAQVEGYLAQMELEARGQTWGPEEMRQQAPAFAVVRTWTAKGLRGAPSPEVRRLQGLVRRAAELLRAVGDDSNAAALENALDGRS